MRPFLGVVAVLGCCPDGGACDFLGEVLEGLEVVVERGVLACCLEAVGEEGGRCKLCEGHILSIVVYSRCTCLQCMASCDREGYTIYILLSTLQV